MKAIKRTSKYELNKGSLQAAGLYNVSENDGEGLSAWFGNELARELRALKAKQFDERCKQLILESETAH